MRLTAPIVIVVLASLAGCGTTRQAAGPGDAAALEKVLETWATAWSKQVGLAK
jgi:hypothetical protein